MATRDKEKISILIWFVGGAVGIALLFYLIQVLGMRSWTAPYYLFKIRWYFILPLVLGFAVQLGLFRAIHLKMSHGGGVMVGSSGGVSTIAMIGCCMHNLASLAPLVGLSGAAVFFGMYQNYIFMISIVFVIGGIIYMLRKYLKICRVYA